jgi:hypothetical protein
LSLVVEDYDRCVVGECGSEHVAVDGFDVGVKRFGESLAVVVH